MKRFKFLNWLVVVLAILAGLLVPTAALAQGPETIEVSQPVQVTNDSHYERGQSIVYYNGMYWLFYGRSASVTGNYQNDNPDVHDYSIFFKRATTVQGLASASATAIPGATNCYLGETGAAVVDDNVWTFCPRPSTSYSGRRSLYGWYTTDGTSWTQVADLVDNMPDGAAHHDEVGFNGKLYVMANYPDGLSGWHTKYTDDPTASTVSWSSYVPLNTTNNLINGTGHFVVDDSALYIAVLRTSPTKDNKILEYVASPEGWTELANASSTGWDPTLFRVNSEWMFAQAPWDGATSRQHLIAWHGTDLATLLGGTPNSVSTATYEGNTWVEMWPIGVVDTEGTSWLLFTSERDEPYEEGTGNIWALEVNWNLDNNHDTFIQPAITAITGSTVNVGPGVYAEQITITLDNLHLLGAGAAVTTIQAPTVLVGDANGSKNLITVSNVNGVEITGFTLTAAGVTNLDIGVYIRDGSADAYVHDNVLENLGVASNNVGILVGRAYHSTTGTATISDNIVSGYGKAGVVVDNLGSSAVIVGNIVDGGGPDPVVAKNGIQVSRGATAIVTGNLVEGHVWSGSYGGSNDPVSDPDADGATAILPYHSGVITITGNILDNNQFGVWSVGAPEVHITNNTFTGTTASGYVYPVGIAISDSDQWTTALGFSETATTGSLSGNTLNGHTYGLLVQDYMPGGAIPSPRVGGENCDQANHLAHNLNNAWYAVGGPNTLDARNNDWGVYAVPAIEDSIWHQPDDATLGRIDYEPFCVPWGAPASIVISEPVTGTELCVGDPVTVTVEVMDAENKPVVGVEASLYASSGELTALANMPDVATCVTNGTGQCDFSWMPDTVGAQHLLATAGVVESPRVDVSVKACITPVIRNIYLPIVTKNGNGDGIVVPED